LNKAKKSKCKSKAHETGRKKEREEIEGNNGRIHPARTHNRFYPLCALLPPGNAMLEQQQHRDRRSASINIIA